MGTAGEVCFFSSTGNSFAIARELAEALSCRLVPISPGATPEILTPGAARLGFVFPVYHASYGGSGVPHIVQEFIGSLGDLSGRDVFVVCTHSGTPGNTIEHVTQLVASNHGKLRVGISVQMSVPRSPWQKLAYMLTRRPLGPIRNEQEKQRILYEDWGRRKAVLLRDLERDEFSVESPGELKKRLWQRTAAFQQRLVRTRYQHLAQSASTDLDDLFRSSDKSFRTNGQCTKCGICARVCPVSNIEIDDGPVWNHRCELCYACYQWCPQAAITGDIVEFEKRYHHPDISLQDMLRRNARSAERGAS